MVPELGGVTYVLRAKCLNSCFYRKNEWGIRICESYNCKCRTAFTNRPWRGVPPKNNMVLKYHICLLFFCIQHLFMSIWYLFQWKIIQGIIYTRKKKFGYGGHLVFQEIAIKITFWAIPWISSIGNGILQFIIECHCNS